MEEQEEKITMSLEFECPQCFHQWEEATDKEVVYNGSIEQKCSYCQSWVGFSRPISEYELLMRRVEVMPTANMSRFPIVIKQLVENVKFKWDE